MDYPVESFTETERSLLLRYFTNLDKPVFALVGLPETVKGALFARYSRYQGTLRRLFLDEFAQDIAESDGGGSFEAESARAARLYENVFLGYGDDSVAQLGGAHVACEWVSNIATKLLQRGRLAAYLEQSTRYIPYDSPLASGRYRYWRDRPLGGEYEQAMDHLFSAYQSMLPRMQAWLGEHFPRQPDEPEAAHTRSIRAKSLDLLRGLLPAASLSHVGIFATGQAYEQLVMRLLASELPEAQKLGSMLLEELKKVIPSFLVRVERPDRGGRWIEYLKERRAAQDKLASRLALDRHDSSDGQASVTCLSVQGSEDDLLAALLFESSSASEEDCIAAVRELGGTEKRQLFGELVGERTNRRHRPGRGFEAVRYRFEIISDYGAFRDLQRHRILTVQWQALSPYLGAEIPEEVHACGLGAEYENALDRSRKEYERLIELGYGHMAPYALCLAYRIRYVLDLNAREAMHLIELRSARQGHASYRAVAHEMYSHIARIHPLVAEAMSHTDHETDTRLERGLAEQRSHKANSAG
jgi:thymidylate synthase ThyX